MARSLRTANTAISSQHAPATPAAQAKRSSMRRWMLVTLGVAASLGVALMATLWVRMSAAPPAELDLATTRPTAQGRYSATIVPGQIQINQLHSWTLHLETPAGVPVENADITVTGDMPQHGHGLPTRPQVTRYLGNGDYLVEGMKFQMGGWWVIDFAITVAGEADSVRFNLLLG